jgi:NAD(P)-dependent dehydrogenase (short-subunit alcohol dehydrogenase family)
VDDETSIREAAEVVKNIVGSHGIDYTINNAGIVPLYGTILRVPDKHRYR